MKEVSEPIYPEGYFESDGCLFGPDAFGNTIRYTFTSLRVYALVRTAENDSWSYDVEVGDSDGNLRRMLISAKDLIAGKNAVLKTLADAGMCIVPGCASLVVAFLMNCRPQARRILALSSGWLEGRNVFVMPTQVIGNTGGAEVIFSPESNSPAQKTIRQQGTLEEWKREVAGRARGNPILIFALLVGFLGPLSRILRLDGGGFHLYGRSSRGKTCSLQGAASIWGEGSDPATNPEKSFIRRWNMTSNAVEGIAAVFSGMLTALDELATMTGPDFGAVVYTLTGGQGKAALNSARKLQKIRNWEGNVLSTGEITTQQKIEEGGKRVKAGQLLRMVNVPTGDNIILDPHGEAPGDFAIGFKRACSTFYGSAGPEFVASLITALEQDGEENRRLLLQALEEYSASLTPEKMEPEQARGIRRFAALQVAGELAVDFGILPYEPEEIRHAVEFARDLWLNENRSIGDINRAMKALRHFILTNVSGFANVLEGNARVTNCKGFRNPNRDVFLFSDEQLAAASGHDPKDLARELRDRGFLATEEVGRLKVGQKIAALKDKRVRLYAIRFSFIESNIDGEEIAGTWDDVPAEEMLTVAEEIPEFEP